MSFSAYRHCLSCAKTSCLTLYVRRAFAPLVEAGFFEVVYGGAEVGTFLTHHHTIESIHLTGSAATFDAVVWGKQPKVPAVCPTGSNA